jgi:NAD/NADP transhydrogenase beta subunit
MNNTNKYLNNGFYLGLISSILFIALIIFMKYFYRLLNDFDTIVVGILGLTIAIISTLGLIKSTKEPKTYKKIIGIILNIGFVLIFLYALISSVFDI